MSDSAETGSNGNPLDPHDVIGAGPDRAQERDAVQASGRGGVEEGGDDADPDSGKAGGAAPADASAPGGEGDAEYPETGPGPADQEKYPKEERPWEGS